MNKIKTTRSILSAVIVAAALGLVACGGGDSGSASVLPSGKVGTVGDGVNASEYEALQCGMTNAEVDAVIGDPRTSGEDTGPVYVYPTHSVALYMPDGKLKNKAINSGGKSYGLVQCQ